MLLQLLVTGSLVKSGPGTGLSVAFLERATVAKDSWNFSCLAPAVGEICNIRLEAITQLILKTTFSFCSEVSDCLKALYFPLGISAREERE